MKSRLACVMLLFAGFAFGDTKVATITELVEALEKPAEEVGVIYTEDTLTVGKDQDITLDMVGHTVEFRPTVSTNKTWVNIDGRLTLTSGTISNAALGGLYIKFSTAEGANPFLTITGGTWPCFLTLYLDGSPLNATKNYQDVTSHISTSGGTFYPSAVWAGVAAQNGYAFIKKSTSEAEVMPIESVPTANVNVVTGSGTYTTPNGNFYRIDSHAGNIVFGNSTLTSPVSSITTIILNNYTSGTTTDSALTFYTGNYNVYFTGHVVVDALRSTTAATKLSTPIRVFGGANVTFRALTKTSTLDLWGLNNAISWLDTRENLVPGMVRLLDGDYRLTSNIKTALTDSTRVGASLIGADYTTPTAKVGPLVISHSSVRTCAPESAVVKLTNVPVFNVASLVIEDSTVIKMGEGAYSVDGCLAMPGQKITNSFSFWDSAAIKCETLQKQLVSDVYPGVTAADVCTVFEIAPDKENEIYYNYGITGLRPQKDEAGTNHVYLQASLYVHKGRLNPAYRPNWIVCRSVDSSDERIVVPDQEQISCTISEDGSECHVEFYLPYDDNVNQYLSIKAKEVKYVK